MADSLNLTIHIARSAAEVYEFASDPANLPRWAAGLTGADIRPEGDAWLAQAPFGKVKIRFAARNAHGVMDHEVEMENGVTFHNPMRVEREGEGSRFIFTLTRQSGMSDAQFAADREAIERDLQTLKRLLEG